jgi:hypothetical protein
LQFALTIQPSALPLSIVEQLVSCSVGTADIVAIPRLTAKLEPNPRNQDIKQKTAEDEIDVSEVLSLLHLVALRCVPDPKSISRFWAKMEFDFVLVMLNKGQPLPDIQLMLEILATSALSTSFGAILDDIERQKRHEMDVLDRLTTLLFETPVAPPAEPPYSTIDVAQLKVSILALIGALIASNHGGLTVATNRLAFGRLVRFLHLSVTSLYSLFVAEERDPVVSAINLTVRILYHIETKFTDVVDVRAKLAAVPGAAHMHLVALGRIAFGEGLILDAGIDEEVVEAAHVMLDEFLSPEEGRALMEAFGVGPDKEQE